MPTVATNKIMGGAYKIKDFSNSHSFNGWIGI